MTVTATSENLWATASGKMAIQGSAKRYKLGGVRARFIEHRQTATLALKLRVHGLGAARRALRRLRRVRAELRLSARDAAGNFTIKRRTIKLER